MEYLLQDSKDMRYLLSVFLCGCLLYGCRSSKTIIKDKCLSEKRALIRNLSSYFIFIENQGTYDLIPDRLDSIPIDVYKGISDSLYLNDLTPYLFSYKEIQLHLLGKKFRRLENKECINRHMVYTSSGT